MNRKLRALIVLLILAGATWAAARTPNGFAGDWAGGIQAGTIKLHFAMRLDKNLEGSK